MLGGMKRASHWVTRQAGISTWTASAATSTTGTGGKSRAVKAPAAESFSPYVFWSQLNLEFELVSQFHI